MPPQETVITVLPIKKNLQDYFYMPVLNFERLPDK
jgi:hypothetical protein